MKPLLLITALLVTASAAAQTPLGYWPPGWTPYWRQQAPAEPKEETKASAPEATPEPAPAPTPVQPAAEKRPPPVAAEEPKGDEKALRAEKHAAAVAAMREGNYAIAYYHWLPLAEAGDAEAQFGIGWMYHNGYGLVIDNHQTLQWWARAAQQGHLDARFALGMLYAEGDEEVARDPRWAADLYLSAARAGHEEARSMLRELLSRGGKRMKAFTAGWSAEDWALFGTPLRVKAKRANYRSAASLKSRVLTVLEAGAELVELSRNGRWVETVVPERNLGGWIHDSLVEAPQDNAGKD